MGAAKKLDRFAAARATRALRLALKRAEKAGATPAGIAAARVEMFRAVQRYLALETARFEVESAEQRRSDVAIARWDAGV